MLYKVVVGLLVIAVLQAIAVNHKSKSSSSGTSNSTSSGSSSGSGSNSSSSSTSGSTKSSSKSSNHHPVTLKPTEKSPAKHPKVKHLPKTNGTKHHNSPKPNAPGHHTHHKKNKKSGQITITDTIETFSNAIFENVTELNKNENIVMSPLAILSLLALMSTGSEGQTIRTFNTVMHLGLTNKQLTTEFHNILKPLQDNPDLIMASSINVRNGYTPNKAFEARAKLFYTSVFLNYFDDPGTIDINNWIKKATDNRIGSLVTASEFTVYTTIVLVNALYFNGGWVHPFEPSKTTSATFYKGSCDSSNAQKVQMMNQVGVFRYGSDPDLDAHILELPFQQGNMTMFVILPNKCDGLSDVMHRLNGYDFNELNGRKHTNVKVSLPKFKMDFTTDLTEALFQMGMGNICANTANFEGLLKLPSQSSSQPFFISKAVHSIKMNVDEVGKTGGAHTKGAISNPTASGKVDTFNANHPFVFMVTTPQSVVFMGKYIGN